MIGNSPWEISKRNEGLQDSVDNLVERVELAMNEGDTDDDAPSMNLFYRMRLLDSGCSLIEEMPEYGSDKGERVESMWSLLESARALIEKEFPNAKAPGKT